MGFQVDDKFFTESILEIIRMTSTNLSHDAVKSIERSRDNEDADTPARTVLKQILGNISLVRAGETDKPEEQASYYNEAIDYFTRANIEINKSTILYISSNRIKNSITYFIFLIGGFKEKRH